PLEELIAPPGPVRSPGRISLVHGRKTPAPLRIRRPERTQNVPVHRIRHIRMPQDDPVLELLEAAAQRSVAFAPDRLSQNAAGTAQAVVLDRDGAVREEVVQFVVAAG